MLRLKGCHIQQHHSCSTKGSAIPHDLHIQKHEIEERRCLCTLTNASKGAVLKWSPFSTLFNRKFASRKNITLPETNSSHLKMDGWNLSFLLGWPIFRGELLVLGSVAEKPGSSSVFQLALHRCGQELFGLNLCHLQALLFDGQVSTKWCFQKYGNPPQSFILIGFSIINHPFLGVFPLFLETPKDQT